MTDDLLRALGAAERRASTVPQPWERVAAGDATPEELEALAAQAATDPGIERRLARFLPLSADEEEGLLAAVIARTSATSPHDEPPAPPSTANEPKPGSTRKPTGVAEPNRPAERDLGGPRRWFGAGALALAASVAFAWLGAPLTETGLPPYRLEVGRADDLHRGDAVTVGPSRHHVGSTLHVVLRPARAVEVGVVGQVFQITEHAIVELGGDWARSPSGSLRFEARVGSLLPGARGGVELLFVVRPEPTPPWKPEPARPDALPSPPLQTFRHRLEVFAE